MCSASASERIITAAHSIKPHHPRSRPPPLGHHDFYSLLPHSPEQRVLTSMVGWQTHPRRFALRSQVQGGARCAASVVGSRSELKSSSCSNLLNPRPTSSGALAGALAPSEQGA